jgi:hypothetical protein
MLKVVSLNRIPDYVPFSEEFGVISIGDTYDYERKIVFQQWFGVWFNQREFIEPSN